MTSTAAAKLAKLQDEQRSLAARIKAARRAAEQEARERRETALRDLGAHVLDVLTGDSPEVSLDVRVAAVRSVLDDPSVLRELARRVGALVATAEPQGVPVGHDGDLGAADGARYAAPGDDSPEGGESS